MLNFKQLIMKRYIKIFIGVFIIFNFLSCEDFLESESNSVFTEDIVFSNLDFATKAVFGAYDDFASLTIYGSRVCEWFQMDTDIECSFGKDNGSTVSYAHYNANEGIKDLKDVWESFYGIIERANICIDNLPVSPIWEGEYEAEAKRLYAEAVTIRALCYYNLINAWGDVPFPIHSTQAGDDFYLSKTDRDSIYEYLIEELANVEDYMPWMRETLTAERINKGFLKGLRARMALQYAGYSLRNGTLTTERGRKWEEYYPIARQECLEIMESGNHQLSDYFETPFKIISSYSQDLTNNEIMFEIAFGKLISGRVCQSIGMKSTKAPAEPKYGRATGEVDMNPLYYYSFDSLDLRRNTAAELYDYHSTSNVGIQVLVDPDGFSPTKWRKEWVVPSMGGDEASVSYTGVNWPLMRYSDIILMFAEAENEINGPTEAAKAALMTVRERAFESEDRQAKVVEYVNSVAGSKEDFFNAIVDERAWELGGELLRKNDLVRWNLLGEKITQMKEDCIKMLNDEPGFENIPDYIYYKYADNGYTIEILNPDYRLGDVTIEGYERSNWLTNLEETNKADFLDKVTTRFANGYIPAQNNHLYPIHIDIITASNGKLSNDQVFSK